MFLSIFDTSATSDAEVAEAGVDGDRELFDDEEEMSQDDDDAIVVGRPSLVSSRDKLLRAIRARRSKKTVKPKAKQVKKKKSISVDDADGMSFLVEKQEFAEKWKLLGESTGISISYGDKHDRRKFRKLAQALRLIWKNKEKKVNSIKSIF